MYGDSTEDYTNIAPKRDQDTSYNNSFKPNDIEMEKKSRGGSRKERAMQTG